MLLSRATNNVALLRVARVLVGAVVERTDVAAAHVESARGPNNDWIVHVVFSFSNSSNAFLMLVACSSKIGGKQHLHREYTRYVIQQSTIKIFVYRATPEQITAFPCDSRDRGKLPSAQRARYILSPRLPAKP